MSDYLFDKEIRIIGLHRSGVSSCQTYLCKHFLENTYIYLNNTRLSFVPRWDYIHRRRAVAEYYAHAFNKVLDIVKKLNKEKKCVNTIEQVSLKVIKCDLERCDSEYNRNKEMLLRFFGKSCLAKEKYNVLILRTPHNNLVDLYRAFSSSKYIERFERFWIEYAEEWLGKTFYLDNKILFNFDKWYTLENYRKKMTDQMGLSYLVFEKWFSSLEKEEMLIAKGHHQTGNVLDCWKEKIRKKNTFSPSYLSVLRNKKIIEYTKKIFDIDIKQLLNLEK